jgi:hypothetical protein
VCLSVSLQAATSELQRTHRRDQQAVDAKYRSLVDAIKEYHISLADAIDAPEESFANQIVACVTADDREAQPAA